MSETEKLKGPASYFPSIEKTYGQPIEHWKAIIRAQDGKAHMQIVAFLKETHGLGALVPIESVIVNVAETQGRRFLKASLTLEVEGESAMEEATSRLPVLRGAVIDVLASKNLDQLVAPDARTQIRGEILETLNHSTAGTEFTDLFFTEFIVQ